MSRPCLSNYIITLVYILELPDCLLLICKLIFTYSQSLITIKNQLFYSLAQQCYNNSISVSFFFLSIIIRISKSFSFTGQNKGFSRENVPEPQLLLNYMFAVFLGHQPLEICITSFIFSYDRILLDILCQGSIGFLSL